MLLLVWDDATSINNPLLKGGLMMTHDEVRADAQPMAVVMMTCRSQACRGSLPSSCKSYKMHMHMP